MTDRLAVPAPLPFGRSASCVQGSQYDPDHNGDVSRHSPTLKVCHFQLPLTPFACMLASGRGVCYGACPFFPGTV